MHKQKGPWIDIKKLREDKGWNQNQTAERLGFSRTYLSSIEHGRRGVSVNMMKKIIKVFGVKYEDFYDDEE